MFGNANTLSIKFCKPVSRLIANKPCNNEDIPNIITATVAINLCNTV